MRREMEHGISGNNNTGCSFLSRDAHRLVAWALFLALLVVNYTAVGCSAQPADAGRLRPNQYNIQFSEQTQNQKPYCSDGINWAFNEFGGSAFGATSRSVTNAILSNNNFNRFEGASVYPARGQERVYRLIPPVNGWYKFVAKSDFDLVIYVAYCLNNELYLIEHPVSGEVSAADAEIANEEEILDMIPMIKSVNYFLFVDSFWMLDSPGRFNVSIVLELEIKDDSMDRIFGKIPLPLTSQPWFLPVVIVVPIVVVALGILALSFVVFRTTKKAPSSAAPALSMSIYSSSGAANNTLPSSSVTKEADMILQHRQDVRIPTNNAQNTESWTAERIESKCNEVVNLMAPILAEFYKYDSLIEEWRVSGVRANTSVPPNRSQAASALQNQLYFAEKLAEAQARITSILNEESFRMPDFVYSQLIERWNRYRYGEPSINQVTNSIKGTPSSQAYPANGNGNGDFDRTFDVQREVITQWVQTNEGQTYEEPTNEGYYF